ncbi:senescence-associated protein [Tanacetum coccineum]
MKSGGNRLLISITVVGSSGPIRFVVNEEMMVATVVDTALKSYAREGRLPVLGSNFNDFVLYCPVVGTEALKPWETIGSFGVRNFMLCKKPHQKAVNGVDDKKPVTVGIRKSSGSWKAWFNKSLNLKVSSH